MGALRTFSLELKIEAVKGSRTGGVAATHSPLALPAR